MSKIILLLLDIQAIIFHNHLILGILTINHLHYFIYKHKIDWKFVYLNKYRLVCVCKGINNK